VDFSPRSLPAYLRTPEGRKKFRFAMVSAVAIAVSEVTLIICYGIFGLDDNKKVVSLTVAFITSTIASYALNRRWVWGRTGRSHFWKEVAPFWGIGFGQFLISVPFITWGVHQVEKETENHVVRTASLLFFSLFVYGVMWVGKFLFFERVLFADRSTERTAV
jgi:putative flippase GtrA